GEDHTVTGDIVSVQLADGRTAELHRLALRDGCPCVDCRHPVSGQRLFESFAVVPDAQIASVSFSEGALAVEWADGHRSTSDADWLAAEADAAVRGRPARPATLWGSELDPARLTEPFLEVTRSPQALGRWLALVAEFGFGVLTAAPAEDDTVARVAE